MQKQQAQSVRSSENLVLTLKPRLTPFKSRLERADVAASSATFRQLLDKREQQRLDKLQALQVAFLSKSLSGALFFVARIVRRQLSNT